MYNSEILPIIRRRTRGPLSVSLKNRESGKPEAMCEAQAEPRGMGSVGAKNVDYD